MDSQANEDPTVLLQTRKQAGKKSEEQRYRSKH